MNPVDETVVSSSPAVWKPYAPASSTPTATPAANPSRGSARTAPQANGASTAVEIAKRTARNANSGYSSSASCTCTKVTPQIAVTAISAAVGSARPWLTSATRRFSTLYRVQVLDTQVHDTLGRPLRDLRISVTDRCNFRCV